MLSGSQAIQNYFAKLGLEPEIADLYLALHTHGPQTISELSRTSGVERTRIYRLIDRLMATNLIEVETRHKRGIVKAAPIANLNILIAQREQELKSLQDELGMLQQVLARNSLSSPAAQVQFFEGPEGMRQMFWSMLQAKTPVRALIDETIIPVTTSRFYQQWAVQANQQKLTFRAILTDAFAKSQHSWHDQHFTRTLRNYMSHITSSDTLPLNHTQIIYDDKVTYYYLADGQQFGVEHQNASTAATATTFFDNLWQSAHAPQQ